MSPLDWICVYVCSTIFPRLGLAAKKKKKKGIRQTLWLMFICCVKSVCTNYKCMKVRYSKTSLAWHQNYNHTHWLAASNPCRGPWTSDTSVWKSSYNTYKKKASGHFVYTSCHLPPFPPAGLRGCCLHQHVEFLVAGQCWPTTNKLTSYPQNTGEFPS